VNDVVVDGLTLNNVLAIAAAVLLVFVSGGVIYLSTVEWRDRRRRQQPVQPQSKTKVKTKAKALR
jgi:hypothetical protein